MTPERSRAIENRVRTAVSRASARGIGIHSYEWDCGAHLTIETASMAAGAQERHTLPCSSLHPGVQHHHTVGAYTAHYPDTEPAGIDLPAAAEAPATRGPRTPDEEAAAAAGRAPLGFIDLPEPAGQDEQPATGYYLVPQADYPPVPEGAYHWARPVTVGPYCFAGTQDRDRTKIAQDIARVRGELAALYAWDDYLAEQEEQARKQEERLQARRDTLVHDILTEVHGTAAAAAGYSYLTVGPIAQAAIDRIIALEDQDTEL